MRIALVYPPHNERSAVFNLAVNLPPIGLASCAAVLRKAGHEVLLLDGAASGGPDSRPLIDRVLAFNPQMAGFSTITANFLSAYTICRAIKEARTSTLTVFGGVHVSWGKELILKRFPAIDCLIAGEGEYALANLAAQADPSSIAGLFYRDGSTIKSGPSQSRETLCDMDDLPFPAYDLIEGFPGKYALPLFSYPRYPGASVISSRGCVYHCEYCDRSVYHTSFRWNSPRYTLELVKWLRTDFGIRHIMFYDDLFTLNRNRVAELCALLRNSKPGMSFNCIVRIGHIDDELIAELKSAGCWMVHVGVESGDQKMLDSFKEGLSLEAIRRDIQKLHNSGLWVKGLFMMGFPGESEESICKTIEFACSLPLKDANITAFTPFPGAPVAEKIANYGSFDTSSENWHAMDCVNFVFVPREIGSKELLEKYYREFIRRFYRRPFMRSVYRKMMFQSPHSYWRILKHASTFMRYAASMKVRR